MNNHGLNDYAEVVHVGFELASNNKRYRKLVVDNDNNAKTYRQWAHRCSGE